ncbi:glycosyltransferase family 4 protein [Nakamurella leprariae]|uniref:Glycosyltransferase family 4 protein n=1 Tax=Nakamurella leprariae TaxID=2803911 RepID=A0A938YDR4_9ACTN|nr:glycosyltransferase family 4 protein [Nakamurella leprariae]MBM9467706.1 glycosyltransferase family 4 protein [Nakamurella leprariae]
MTAHSVLIVTDDVLGARMAGPGIRAWNIAEVLATAGHDVRLASTRKADLSSPRFAVCDGSADLLRGLAQDVDIILLQGFTLRSHPWLARLGAHLVMDMYDPIHLEILEGSAGNDPETHVRELAGGLQALRVQFEEGDFFLCASERQRDLWLGWLSAAGRINPATYRQDSTLRSLIDLAPFGIGAEEPLPAGAHGAVKGVMEGIGVDDRLLIWAGGVYNWFDPITLVEAVADLVADVPDVRLLFMGTKHPSLDDLSTTVLRAAMDRAEALGLLGRHVFFREGWVPYADRGRYLADADIGVSTHVVHVETAFSFRTRMLDYLWAGLPIVCTEGDEFAGIVRREQLGRVVAEGDRTGLTAALRELLTDPAELARCRTAATAVAARFRWEQALAPLVRYCADPWRAPDKDGGSRPVDRRPMVGGRLGDRLAHAQEYVRVNGRRQFVRVGSRRVAAGVARRIARLLPARLVALLRPGR